MRNILAFLFLLSSLACEEEPSSHSFDEWVNGTVLSTSSCTGNGVILSVETENRSIHKALEAYGDQRTITVFNTDLSELEVGEQISFRILDLTDTARVCLMLWEGPRGPEAKIEIQE